jgi:TonB family protein
LIGGGFLNRLVGKGVSVNVEVATRVCRVPIHICFEIGLDLISDSVGEAQDGGTLRGLAKLVYGDKKMWIQIYAANRDVVSDPNALSYGMSLTIPPSHQPAPKLETKVLPSYPSEAASQHVHGDVAMDLTLSDDGTVQEVKVIEGNPLLKSASTDAVKQWKYRPLTVHGKLVNRIVVVLTFDKNGKVR